MKSRALFLVPCSSSKSPTAEIPAQTRTESAGPEDGPHKNEEGSGVGEKEGEDLIADTNAPPTTQIEGGGEEEAVASRRLLVKKKKRQKGGVIISKPKRAAGASSSSSSTATASSSSNLGAARRRGKRWGPRGVDDDHRLQDLALPLGMSFAAIVSQVLDGINGSRDRIPIDQLYQVCTSAIKESIANIYGDRFECFLLNFDKSFGSTLRTLRLISEASAAAGYQNESSQIPTVGQRNRTVSEQSIAERDNISCGLFPSSESCEVVRGERESLDDAVEKVEDILPLATVNNQIVLHGQMNQELASASHRFSGSGVGQSILSTFQKSVVEQTRSNDLKAFEISLISRKLQLKESQLALSSYANMLEKIKISMGISKASFKTEKLKNQMLDARHAEFLRKCIDLLVAGLIIMSACLGYGTYIYSYQRITEATSSCSVIPKESKSWWIPKQVSSFNSGWLLLRCHVVALTRMFFGLALIVAIAYSVFQRSAVSTTTIMPITSILILGVLCGTAGKLCVDTLGGSGSYWLLHWETLCLLHFFANIFPPALYRLLYGPICVSQIKAEGRLMPYWLRRFMFNFIVAIVYPAMTGLLPFAPLGDWKVHFSEKITRLINRVENQQ